MVVIVRGRADANVRVYRRRRGEAHWTCLQERHNLVLTSGLNQLRDACNGAAWQLSAIGLGSSGTAVAASQTWGLSPLVVGAPTSSYYKGNLFRASYLLEEDELNGDTIRELWLAPTTTAPPTGDDAYARVVIDAIAKTSDYAYLFIWDCTWGGGCVAKGWEMLAAQAASAGAYSFRLDECLFGSGTKAESTGDTALELPWVMSRLALASSTATVDGELTLQFTIPPDTYVGSWAREMAIYATVESGTFPIAEPRLFTRNLIATPYEVQPDEGATAVCVITWEAA